MKKQTCSYKGKSWTCEVIKSAHLSSGANVYLIRRDMPIPAPYTNPIVVAVRVDDCTKEWLTFTNLQRGIPYYLDMLACYA